MEKDLLFKDNGKVQGELTIMNRKFNTTRQNVERLEMEIATKDRAIALAQLERKKAEKLGQQKQTELNRNKKSIEVRVFKIDG